MLTRINKETGKKEYLVGVYEASAITDEQLRAIAQKIVENREELIKRGFVKGAKHE